MSPPPLSVVLSRAPLRLVETEAPPIAVVEISRIPIQIVQTTAPVDIVLHQASKGDKGDPGEQGIQGEQGPPGEGSLVWIPPQAQTTWLIVHNLGRFPSVTAVDSLGRWMVGDLAFIDDNTVQLDFAYPTTGYAYIN